MTKKNAGWVKHSDGFKYQKFYMGMIFSDGKYYDKDAEGNWYYVEIDKEGYPEFGNTHYVKDSVMGSEPKKEIA